MQAMQILNTISTKVKDGSLEMRSGTDSLTTSMDILSKISAEVLSAMDEITNGTKGISEAMNEVITLTIELGETANKTNLHVNKFKTE